VNSSASNENDSVIMGNVGGPGSSSTISTYSGNTGNQTTEHGSLANGNRDNYRIYNSNQQSFDVVDAPGNKIATQNASKGTDQSISRGTIINGGILQRQNPGGDPGPYRVVLREDQLQELTADFHVYSLSCGRQAFVIAEPPLADNRPRSMLAKSGESDKAGDALRVKSKASAMPALKPSQPATSPSLDLSAKRDIRDLAAQQESPKPGGDFAVTGGAAAQGGQSASQAQAVQQFPPQEKYRWIDCVIKMEPQPSRINASQLNSQIPQNSKNQQQPAAR
jgi:hypothetical protein